MVAPISSDMLMVACPQCNTPVAYSTQNASRPFCSERCRQIDLGAWANEEFRVPAKDNAPDQLDSLE